MSKPSHQTPTLHHPNRMSTQREASRARIAQVHPGDRFAAMFGEQVEPAPAFGEPWRDLPSDMSGYLLNDQKFRRAVACVNACAGMADPAAEIAKLRRERDAAREKNAEVNKDVFALLQALSSHDVTEGVLTIRTMREAIKEAHAALNNSLTGETEPWLAAQIEAALAKLQPLVPSTR